MVIFAAKNEENTIENFDWRAMSGSHIKEHSFGWKEHTSFEDYNEDVPKLSKMAEQIEFTIIGEENKGQFYQ